MANTTELEERVIASVVEERGEERERVELTSSLAEDLGMDGDDAVYFFKKFSEGFHVDLTLLYEHWDEHFGPELAGIPGLGFLVAIGAAVFLGGVVHETVKRIPAWAATLGLIVIFWWAHSKLFGARLEEKLPIRVQDLVDAALARKWVRTYEASPPELFRSIQ
jgi:hypothetical protein